MYFGDGAYGAEAAAETYFGKSAADLSLDEAPALAGFLHSPSTYLPEEIGEGSEIATERRNAVLEMMAEQAMISSEELDEAEDVAPAFTPDQLPDDPVHEPFVEGVRREVRRDRGRGPSIAGVSRSIPPSIYTLNKSRGIGAGDLDESATPPAPSRASSPRMGR